MRLPGGRGQQILQRVLRERREITRVGDRLRLRTRQLPVTRLHKEAHVSRYDPLWSICNQFATLLLPLKFR